MMQIKLGNVGIKKLRGATEQSLENEFPKYQNKVLCMFVSAEFS